MISTATKKPKLTLSLGKIPNRSSSISLKYEINADTELERIWAKNWIALFFFLVRCIGISYVNA